MSLRTDAQVIAAYFKHCSHDLDKNRELLDIQEGNLLPYVEKELQAQLSKNAFEVCRHRIPPINIQKQVINKLSTIYEETPERDLGEKATEEDKRLWNQYVDQFSLDVSGQVMNEYFNLLKGCAWEPYLDPKFRPRLRELPRDRFFVMGRDPTDPMRVTHFIKVMGLTMKGEGKEARPVQVLYCYTDTEFLIIDEEGEVLQDLMNQKGADGTNPFGRIPMVYLNRSRTKINAGQDSDMYRMVTLIPCLFADVNYAVMFQAFSIFYGVNIDVDTIPINPNAFIKLAGNVNNPGAEPKLGVIKPELDSDKAITAIMEQLSLWLQSRGIRPGAVGKAGPDTSISGLSKMVDEMDTTGDRKKQIPFFVQAEEDLFDLVAYHLHPEWTKNPSFQEKAQFTKEVSYSVSFAEQVAMKTRTELLQETKLEMDMGLLSQESAFKKVNPEMPEKDQQAELAKIQGEQQKKADEEAKKFAARAPFGGQQ